MANTSAPRGFYNPRLRTGGTPNTRPYKVTAASVPIVPGMVVAQSAAGTVTIATTVQMSNITQSTYNVLGVAMSSLTTTSTTLSVSGQAGVIEVVDDLENTLWDVQLSHAATSQALVGESLAVSSNNVVQSTLNQSRGVCIAAATGVTTGPCQVVDFVKDDANESTNANPRATIRWRIPSGATTAWPRAI